MNEESDKKEFIEKFLIHINLKNADELIYFNAKTSHIYFAGWVFLLISITSVLIFPEYFPFYKFILNSKITNFLHITYEKLNNIMLLFSFISLVKAYSIYIRRNELIKSLYGLKILLEYMRVDEVSFFNNLKRIYPNVEDFEIATFTSSVFEAKIFKKNNFA
ncbi:hypothetical protein P3G55_16660 [Leptospira sp. 96542]|nr:hypothetical protein [Leptospira sp. 96542]